MGEFSATAAATEGFSILRRSPLSIVVWAAMYVVLVVAAFAIVAGVVGVTALTSLEQTAESGTPDLSTALGILGSLAGAIAIILPLGIIVTAMVLAAVNRAVLRPEQTSLGYLRLGMDEVRVFCVRFVMGLLFVLFALAIAVVCALLGQLHWSLGLLAGLAGFGLMIFVAVRLSLAVPQSFATRSFNLFGSWSLTKGHFWPMLGAYLLALVIYLAIALAVGLVMAILTLAGMAGTGALTSPEAMTTGAFGAFGIMALLRGLVQAIVSSLGVAITVGASAKIYQGLAGVGQAEAF